MGDSNQKFTDVDEKYKVSKTAVCVLKVSTEISVNQPEQTAAYIYCCAKSIVRVIVFMLSWEVVKCCVLQESFPLRQRWLCQHSLLYFKWTKQYYMYMQKAMILEYHSITRYFCVYLPVRVNMTKSGLLLLSTLRNLFKWFLRTPKFYRCCH